MNRTVGALLALSLGAGAIALAFFPEVSVLVVVLLGTLSLASLTSALVSSTCMRASMRARGKRSEPAGRSPRAVRPRPILITRDDCRLRQVLPSGRVTAVDVTGRILFTRYAFRTSIQAHRKGREAFITVVVTPFSLSGRGERLDLGRVESVVFEPMPPYEIRQAIGE